MCVCLVNTEHFNIEVLPADIQLDLKTKQKSKCWIAVTYVFAISLASSSAPVKTASRYLISFLRLEQKQIKIYQRKQYQM